ncbi:cytochrome P450 [Streptomyces phaeochromogenes]|uniref:cytochrome P450 n=1 Tax=Streptomyces phaeochromogenes TaxID=1923 RepID=UPI0038639167|nr:cytochrome P450 [Streptomyces phaeochromogenes]
MSDLATRWGVEESRFWLHGRMPQETVRFDEQTGLWNVYGHAEAFAIFADPATYSSDTARVFLADSDLDVGDAFDGNPVVMDPPFHGRMRKLVSRAFTPKTVAELAPRIAALTHELLDDVAGRDRVELVSALAYPLPVIVIAELLGVPAGERDVFKGWVDKIFDSDREVSLESTEEQRQDIEEGLEQARELREYLRGHADERRRAPREDLLTKLVEAEVDGQRLSSTEVANFANVLLVAGHVTTTMLIGNTLLCLDADPDADARLRADRSLLPSTIEESLRYMSPFASLYRATMTEAEIAGQRIPKDQLLAVRIGAANRDERVFERPHTFDPGRDPNPHVGFGHGIHFCLGAPLARLEGRIALDILLDRFPVLRADPEHPPTFLPSPDLTGVKTLTLLSH